MKYLLLVFILLSTLAQAETMYSIKIASFNKSCVAKDGIKKLDFLDLSSLNEKHDLEYKVKRYGQYYVLKLELFTNKEALQKAVDQIRIIYKDAYVSKIKSESLSSTKQVANIKIVEKEKIVIKTEIKEVIKVVKVPVEVVVIEESKLFKILFFILLVLFVISLSIILKLRKKQEELEEKNRQLAEYSLDFDNLILDESEIDLDIDINMEEIFGTKESIK